MSACLEWVEVGGEGGWGGGEFVASLRRCLFTLLGVIGRLCGFSVRGCFMLLSGL